MIIHSNDTIPYDEIMKNKNLILATHPSGGHLAFLTGWKTKQWFQYPVINYIETLISLGK